MVSSYCNNSFVILHYGNCILINFVTQDADYGMHAFEKFLEISMSLARDMYSNLRWVCEADLPAIRGVLYTRHYVW